MKRAVLLLWMALLAAVAYAIPGITRRLPAGDAARGREVLRSQQCLTCHSLNGEGARLAPDLGRRMGRGFVPATLASAMWNHAPAMWSAMAKKGITRPELSEQQAADLFAHFFATTAFELPGDRGRGARVFEQLKCSTCHGVTSAKVEGILPVAEWGGPRDPVELAQKMWNHSGAMRDAFAREGVAPPKLASQDLADLLAFAQGQPGKKASKRKYAPSAPGQGEKVYRESGCEGCHSGDRSLASRPTRYSMTDFGAAMWNHSGKPGAKAGTLAYEQMYDLVGYLVHLQLLEERGDVEHGRKVFDEKKCATCHSGPGGKGPDLAGQAGLMTSFRMVEVLWKHGPAMHETMKADGISWPRLSPDEMADLGAYLHGARLKRRGPAGTPRLEAGQ
jgi:mono/diheme cytochrome c family protein